jgi:hypothetical protein
MVGQKIAAAVVLCACLFSHSYAQDKTQVQQLSISAPLRTEAPFRTLFGRRFCDSSGAVYVRYFPEKGKAPFAAPITKIERAGNTKEIPIGKLTGLDSQLASFAVDSGKVFEVLVTAEPNSASSGSYFAVFDHNGSLVSKNKIDLPGVFFPTILVPFSNGDFFASGTQVISGKDKASSSNHLISAVFSADGVLKRRLGKAKEGDADFITRTDELVNAEAYVGEDQKLYLFQASSPVKVQVFDATARLERTLTLASPIGKAKPASMFLSSGRALVTWTPETDEPGQSSKLALYDIQSGDQLRVYDTNFRGSPVCFEEGKTLTILTVMDSGFFGLASADLR